MASSSTSTTGRWAAAEGPSPRPHDLEGGGVTARRPARGMRRGLSDRSVVWLFVAPTLLLLLAINIFPLLWNIYLSFTDYRANQPSRPVRWVGLQNYDRLLGSEDIWGYLQVTAHFVCWSILVQVLVGFGLAWLLNRQFKGHAFWSSVIVLPMMLSPAVVGIFWTYLFQPQAGIFNYIVEFLHPRRRLHDDRRRPSGALGDRDGRQLDVDAVRHADLSRRPALDPRIHLRGRRGRRRLVLAPVLDDHDARWSCRS